MLTIKGRTTSENVVFEKKSLTRILKDTSLSYLTDINEYVPNTITTFDEILNIEDIDDKMFSDMFDIFKRFLNKKTSIVVECSGIIDVIITNIPSHSVMDRLKLTILPSMIPYTIQILGLTKAYEQLIVYEYIYMSEYHTLYKKLDIIVENDYDLLLTLLEDCSLDICTTSAEIDLDESKFEANNLSALEISQKAMINLRHKYYLEGHNIKIKYKMNLFNRFIELHEKWLTYDVGDLDQIDDKSISIADMLYSRNDVIPYMTPSDILKNLDINSANAKTPCLSIEEYCYLNNYYQEAPNKANSILQTLLFLLKTDSINSIRSATDYLRSDDDNIRTYESLDLVVRMMEDNNELLSLIPKRVQEKIVIIWLKMSSPTYTCFRYCCEYPYQYYNVAIDKSHGTDKQIQRKMIRKITLSDTIRDIISNMHITFDELGYILATDNLEMFELMCKHIEFRFIHQTFYKYLPPKILECIINRSCKAHNKARLVGSPKFTINMYDLVERTKEQLKYVLNMLNKSFDHESIIELVPINDRYEYIECLYIVMYWDYLTLLITNPERVLNIVTVLSSVRNIRDKLSSYHMDVIILKTVLDNIASELKKADNQLDDRLKTVQSINIQTSIQISLSKLIEHMSTDNDMLQSGPDFTEIHEELTKCKVKNLDYISKLKSLQDKIQNNTYVGNKVSNMHKYRGSPSHKIENSNDEEDDEEKDE